MLTIREQLEAREDDYLAPQAAHSARSRGRLRDEAPDPIRPVFQRDRDRVIHSKAFRRLKRIELQEVADFDGLGRLIRRHRRQSRDGRNISSITADSTGRVGRNWTIMLPAVDVSFEPPAPACSRMPTQGWREYPPPRPHMGTVNPRIHAFHNSPKSGTLGKFSTNTARMNNAGVTG